MKFMSYNCEFVGKINEIHILINEKSNREIPGFFKISRDISRPKIEPGSRELNPICKALVDIRKLFLLTIIDEQNFKKGINSSKKNKKIGN